MAKNSREAYGAVGKSNVLLMDPADLTIVTEKTHHLYDERVNLPLDERMVLNIMHHGVIMSITINKNPETGDIEVVDGRQRARAAVEANKRLKAQGRDPITVPCIPKRLDGLSLAGMMVSANEIRNNDGPIVRAQKMARLEALGTPVDELAILFGCTKQTITASLKLLDCTAVVRNAVEAGKLTVTQAQKLANLVPAAQKEVVAELTQATEGKKGHDKAKAARAVVDVNAVRMRGKKEITEILTRVDGDALKALSWVLGGNDISFASTGLKIQP